MKRRFYIWIAKWESICENGNPIWSSYISPHRSLSDPKVSGNYSMDESDAITSMIMLIQRHEHEYTFIVVEHPDKMKYMGKWQHAIWSAIKK